VSLSPESFAGGARELTIAADTVISRGNASHWAIEASGAGLKVKLELPTDWTYRVGFPVFILHNKGATHAWSLCTNNGTVLQAVAVGAYARVGLADLAGQGSWRVS